MLLRTGWRGAMSMLASAAQGIKNRMTQPPGTGCGPRSAKGSVWRPFKRASISALLTSGTETVCAAALLCCCGFCGSRGCCGKEDSPARGRGVDSHVKLFEHNPRSWILEGLEPNANRLKMVDSDARASRRRWKRLLSIKSAVEGV